MVNAHLSDSPGESGGGGGNGNNKKWTFLGQDPALLLAISANVLSWFFSTFFPRYQYLLLPPPGTEPIDTTTTTATTSASGGAAEDDNGAEEGSSTKGRRLAESTTAARRESRTRCVSIGRPGGMEQLRVITLKDGIATVGYNVRHLCQSPFTPELRLNNTDDDEDDDDDDNPASTTTTTTLTSSSSSSGGRTSIPDDCAVLKNEYFSVNYADCCIRWGLYESANKFVGYPIVPGFDVAGTIEAVGDDTSFDADNNIRLQKGDRVFGCTLFGAYSSRVLLPKIQLRRIPDHITTCQAAAIPAVSLTALYALYLAGAWPHPIAPSYRNGAVLIHSAAGGVGSMLVQMSKLLGLGPIVGVVGSHTKVNAAQSLGCDVVIDKSSSTTQDLWRTAERHAPDGYVAIFDANGASTFQGSYDHLCPTGRLIIFGFHSNLPLGKSMLSPWEWIGMARKAVSIPRFDPMDMVVSNKSVLAFNLSFFADEKDVVTRLFDQVCAWLETRKLQCPNVVEVEDMEDIGKAHGLIQSGKSIGKIVVRAT